MLSRRNFMQRAAAITAATFTAKSYAQIIGANDRVNFAVVGLNSRGGAHISAVNANRAKARLSYLCDVDRTILERVGARAAKTPGNTPKLEQDFRRALASKDVDAITVATPDHWHTPMSLLAMEAGKHVYVEKPCSYSPEEGRMLVRGQAKYGRVCQMGSQQRSSPHTIAIIDKIHNGLIGKAYWAETWYTNNRRPIGTGHVIDVPPTLDWDLWQGPAPRTAYRSNVHPYNWHWFRRWGTGESLNNGTHEVDVARWALGVEYPTRIAAQGGRYAAKDDWEFYDTLDVSMTYPDHLMTWKGDCITGKRTYDRDRGVAIHGNKGTVVLDRDGYDVFDTSNKLLDTFRLSGGGTSTTDLVGADHSTDAHFGNFIAAIQTGETLRQPVAQGNVAGTILQYANISYFTGREITLNPATSEIVGDKEADAMTRRTYEPGWTPKV